MKPFLLLTETDTHSIREYFGVSDCQLIKFSRDLTTNHYSFTFVNDKGYSSLSFIFSTPLEVDCYFKYVQKDGRTKFVGYKKLKSEEQTVNISDCSEFSIIIPRDKNRDVCTVLTLVALDAH